MPFLDGAHKALQLKPLSANPSGKTFHRIEGPLCSGGLPRAMTIH